MNSLVHIVANTIGIIACVVACCIPSHGQTYLYLEDMREIRAVKIPVGATISIKTNDEPKWTSYRITRLLDADGVILHEQGMIDLKDVTHLRIQRQWVKALAYSLQTFGAAWALYGGIVLLATTDGTTLPIVLMYSLVPYVAGYLMKKIWLYKNYKIGSKNRLRILDLSFPDDPYGVKKKRVIYYP